MQEYHPENDKKEENKEKKEEKWSFEDYAFTITGIIVGILLVGPELMDSFFGIRILGGSLNDIMPDFGGIEDGSIVWTLSSLRSLSPLLFLLTTTIVFFKEAFDARKDGGYTGSLFTHTFESLFEDGIYMAITTVMVYGAVLFGAMYASWLAGPITWVLFIFIFPLVRGKTEGVEEEAKPWGLLVLFALGIIAEIITGVWIAFPLVWLIISAIKLVDTIRQSNHSVDTVFNILYHAFTVILLGVGLLLDFWLASWAAFPIAIFICWILSKTKRFKKLR